MVDAAVTGTESGWSASRLRAMRGESAQAAIEMALSLPLFLAIVFGMIQTSILMQTYCNATYACRNAARYASIHSSTSLAPSVYTDIQAMVKTNLFLNSSITPTINVNYFNAGNLAGSTTNLCAPPNTGVDNSLNVVGNIVCVQTTWSQGLSIPFMKINGFSVGTQTYKVISR